MAWLFLLLVASAQSEPTLSTCTGQQNFSLAGPFFDLCVEIKVDASFTSAINSFVIDWGDGTTASIPVDGPFPPTPIPSSIQHTYNFAGFFGTCTAKENRAFFVHTYVTGDPIPLNNGFIGNVFNLPTAAFFINSPVWSGEAVQLNNGSCPTSGLTTLPWVYGEGSSGTSGVHTYAQTGTNTVTLTVANQCDTVSTSQSLSVLELPVSYPVATAGVQEIVNDTLIVCLRDTLSLNGDSLSRHKTSWQWKRVQFKMSLRRPLCVPMAEPYGQVTHP
ncbi:MAG: hypothetical protein RLY31_34 [Bacteroidota bacterium]